jgi:hypothetical protein
MPDAQIEPAPDGAPANPGEAKPGLAAQAWALMTNLVPLAGVLVLGWDAMLLLLFYWIETLVIGVFNALKIGVIGWGAGRMGMMICAGMIAFFSLHYGIFCSGHGEFLVMLMHFGGGSFPESNASFGEFGAFSMAWSLLGSDADLWWSVVAVVALQAGAFVLFWLWPGTWRTANPFRQMFEPYGRIVVMHLTIMFAALPVLLLGAPWLAVLALAVMKTGLDLRRPLFTFNMPGSDRVWAEADKYWPPRSLPH